MMGSTNATVVAHDHALHVGNAHGSGSSVSSHSPATAKDAVLCGFLGTTSHSEQF